MNKQTFVIVGASLAGGRAAGELRERGFDGRLIVIGAERERPYERPPLSKDYLRGESERDKAYLHPQDFYAQHEIELRTGTEATSIDPGAGTVTLVGGIELSFDKLLLTLAQSCHDALERLRTLHRSLPPCIFKRFRRGSHSLPDFCFAGQ